MKAINRQFWQIIRTYLIRYSSLLREKNTSQTLIEQFQITYTKLLHTSHSHINQSHNQQEMTQLGGLVGLEAVLKKLSTIQCKNDNQNILMLSLFQQLCKWSRQYYQEIINNKSQCLLQSILHHSISLLNAQQQVHTIVLKQFEFVAAFLVHPYTINNLEHFKILYRKLKDVKEYYAHAVKEAQKVTFLRCMEECLDVGYAFGNIEIYEFIFSNIFGQLQLLQESHEYVSPRLRILKKIVKTVWVFHEQILFKTAFLLMKYSYSMINVSASKHLLNNCMNLYENLLEKLLQRPSITALLIYKHVVLNNIVKLLKNNPPNSDYLSLETLLLQLSNIFQPQYLEYFMRHYDWNYTEVSICQESLNVLYQYVENRSHQKKYQYQLIKKYILRINFQIKQYLQHIQPINKVNKESQQWRFYQLKKKQYMELIEDLNLKPKNIFKKIQNITNTDIKEGVIEKYVKIIKKTSHLNTRAMIDIFSSQHQVSQLLFSHYVEIFFRQCKEANLEEFLRLFTSNFFITGESQQIARVMDKITQLYYSHQLESEKVIKDSDSTYTFANAILLLNTDLHHPKNEQKISQQNFIKMCKKINGGEDLPVEMLKKTYCNIKKNKINTFRDRGNMIGISSSNWQVICCDYQSINLQYFDPELRVLDDSIFYCFVEDVLTSIIDQKQTTKLEDLVQRFQYDDQVFQCEIIHIITKIAYKKPHMPLHILQKVLEIANFKHNKLTEKVISYYWLAANLILNFHANIPTNLICQFLVFNWNIRFELQDNFFLRESADIKRIKKCLKFISKRQAKKSIMDMFSSFLSKDEDEERDPLQFVTTDLHKRNNFKALSFNIFQILKNHAVHTQQAINFMISYIYQTENIIFQEFLSCLFIIFHLLYKTNQTIMTVPSEDLIYQLLGLKQSQITKRIINLQKKDQKKYQLLTYYYQFWVLKLLLSQYGLEKEGEKQANFNYLLQKSLQFLNRSDRHVIADLAKQLQKQFKIQTNIYDLFMKNINKVYEDTNNQEIKWFVQRFSKEESKLLKKISSKKQPSDQKLDNINKQFKEMEEHIKQGQDGLQEGQDEEFKRGSIRQKQFNIENINKAEEKYEEKVITEQQFNIQQSKIVERRSNQMEKVIEKHLESNQLNQRQENIVLNENQKSKQLNEKQENKQQMGQTKKTVNNIEEQKKQVAKVLHYGEDSKEEKGYQLQEEGNNEIEESEEEMAGTMPVAMF